MSILSVLYVSPPSVVTSFQLRVETTTDLYVIEIPVVSTRIPSLSIWRWKNMPAIRQNQNGVTPWDGVLRMSGMESNTDDLEERVRRVMPLPLESHNNRDRHSNI